MNLSNSTACKMLQVEDRKVRRVENQISLMSRVGSAYYIDIAAFFANFPCHLHETFTGGGVERRDEKSAEINSDKLVQISQPRTTGPLSKSASLINSTN